MRLTQRTITRLREHVNGDSGGYTVDGPDTPYGKYRSGPVLVSLFNEFGADDQYEKGFPSRKEYTTRSLNNINGTQELARLIRTVFDPLEFADVRACEAAIADFNRYLERDGYILDIKNGKLKIITSTSASVNFEKPDEYEPATFEFIQENIQKCDIKLREGDYSGAITNARSICEDVLFDLETALSVVGVAKYDGNLPKLFKRVMRLLKADPAAYEEHESVVQLLRGLVSICDGLAGMSNPMGDRHGGQRIRAKRHHAELAINAANTLCNFAVASYVQRKK